MGSNTAASISAYDRVVRDELSWLLLHYPNANSEDLELHSSGSEGLEELKTKIYDIDQVFVAFYREETEDNPGYILINYIPTCTTPIRRARALVHSRRVGAIFKKHQTMLTIDNLSQLTTPVIHKALVQPESFAASTTFFPSPTTIASTSSPLPLPPNSAMGASMSTETAKYKSKRPKPIALDLARRSFSETYAPHHPIPQSVPPLPAMPSIHQQHQPKSSGMLGLLRRNKKKSEYSSSSTDDHDRDLPPPPPPKDSDYQNHHQQSSASKYKQLYYSSASRDSPPPAFVHAYKAGVYGSPTGSFTELGALSHFYDPDLDQGRAPHGTAPFAPPALPRKKALPQAPAVIEHSYTLPLRGKWARDLRLPSDPKEREKLRKEAQRQREVEEQREIEEEMRRQDEIRRRKEEERRREEQEEIVRKVRMEEKLKRIAAERERKRRWEEEEEERKRLELEERKRVEREKRAEEHRKAERWRRERDQSVAEEARRTEDARQRQEEDRKQKIKQAERLVVQAQSTEPTVTTGWVTVQFHDSLFWKRRFYRFVGTDLHLHRSPEDLNTALETVPLRGKVSGLKEWKDGYEELEAIPFSFVVEFQSETWSMFADSEQEKFRFLGLMHHALGIL